jgi:8-oxo-dGTP pyrophosphatase MutT (NUDIX family)
MTERLVNEINNIFSTEVSVTEEVRKAYLQRLTEGQLTRDENPQTHFCVYFAGFSPETNEVFIGHHKKSGLWLFNGGHIDEGETPTEALFREIGEEWGDVKQIGLPEDAVGKPELLTITEIDNPTKQKCRRHYDIWHFVWADKNTFRPDQSKLDKEFHETRWVSLDEAKSLITDPSTLEAIDHLDK